MAQSPFDIEVDDMTLALARRGNLAACERIFRAFQQPAFSVAYRICQCRETAQEVTQDAFITAFRKIRQFRGDAPFWGWLRRVVVNHAISTLRRRPAVHELEYQEYQAATAAQQELVGLAMDLEAALAALAPLADEGRVVYANFPEVAAAWDAWYGGEPNIYDYTG